LKVSAFIALVRKDIRLWASSRRAVVMGLIAPVSIAAFFGYIFDSARDKPSRIPMAVTDLDGSTLSGAVAAALVGDGALDVRAMPEDAAAQAVTRGELSAAVVLPKGFGESAPGALSSQGARPEITIRHDPSQAMALPVVRGLLTQHVMETVGRSLFGGVAGSPASASAFRLPFDTREIAATAKPAQDYNSYAHSFAGMGVQFILFMGIEFGVGLLLVKRTGLWQRLRASPVSPALLLVSRIVSAALIAFGLLVAIFIIAMLFFGVHIQGSELGFIGVALAFALLTGSFGLLIAALGKTPEATRSLAILATLAMVMLGGAWVPTFVFPEWLRTASMVVPTRWAVDGLDAVTWRGQGLASVLPAIGALLAFAAAFTLLAIWRFDWEER
jgi:ABC-2 type transport system permease protein